MSHADATLQVHTDANLLARCVVLRILSFFCELRNPRGQLVSTVGP